jgi:hypothetical protein
MKTTALAALLDEFHRFGTPSHPDQQICCCNERDIELARAELDEIQAYADLPCYLCAVPGKDERCRTSVCANCGHKLLVERDQLRAENRKLKLERAIAIAELHYANAVTGDEEDRWLAECDRLHDCLREET